jgi:type IV secretory pathway VirJ component
MKKPIIGFLYLCLIPFLPAKQGTLNFSASQPVPDLPLIEVPATGGNTDLMGILLTGDGGYGVTDRGIAESLASKGVSVVVLNSLHYFWKQKNADQAAADLNRILQYYCARWKRNEVVVIGYSFGADVLPFMLNRIPKDSLQKINAITLLGPGSTADFQFHLTDWIVNRKRSSAQPVRPEIEKLRGKKILCFYGTGDGDALCSHLDAGLVKAIPLEGGHRLGKGYQPIIDEILKEAQ